MAEKIVGATTFGAIHTPDPDAALAAMDSEQESTQVKVEHLRKQIFELKNDIIKVKNHYKNVVNSLKIIDESKVTGVLPVNFKSFEDVEKCRQILISEARCCKNYWKSKKSSLKIAQAEYERAKPVLNEFDCSPLSDEESDEEKRVFDAPKPAIEIKQSPAQIHQQDIFKYQCEDGTWEAHKWRENLSPTEIFIAETAAKGVLPGVYYSKGDSPTTVTGRLTPAAPRDIEVLATPYCPHKLELKPEHAYKTAVRLLTPLVALEDATGAKYVHMDIKPENIVVSEEGEIFLIDYGLAKDEEAFEAMWTKFQNKQLQIIPGNYHAIPPEAIYCEGERIRLENYDSWGIGIMIYRMLSGKIYPGFTGETLQGAAANQIYQTVYPIAREIKEKEVFKDLRLIRGLATTIRRQLDLLGQKNLTRRQKRVIAVAIKANKKNYDRRKANFETKFPDTCRLMDALRQTYATAVVPAKEEVERLRPTGGEALLQAEKKLREMTALFMVMQGCLEIDPMYRITPRKALAMLPHDEADLKIPLTQSALNGGAGGES